jgi:tetratricopeptide (TPR) repeat protein
MALVIAVFVAFGSVLSGAFVNYDDDIYITENARVQAGLTVESVGWAFRSTEAANWHPVTWLSHMLDVQLFGLDPGKHHLTSLVLHALNAILLFLLLFRMTGALWRSAFAAALFALHPLHVESVAWVAERKDVLSTLFWLLTLAAWLAYTRSKRPGWYILALALYALGLMAKPMLVTLPFTLLLLDYWPLRRLEAPLRGSFTKLGSLVGEKVPLFAMSAASCAVTFSIQHFGGATRTLDDSSFAGRLANASLAYIAYLGQTLWPTSLAVFYPYRQSGYGMWAVVSAVALLFCVTALVLWQANRSRYLAFGWLWYLGTLIPVIGIVQVGMQARADRYTYVPLIGIFIAVAWGLDDLVKRNRAARHAVSGAAVAVLVLLLAGTRVQCRHWSDSAALWEHALSVTSGNYLAHYNLGVILSRQGKREEAIAHYAEAVRIKPDYLHAHNNLGIALGAAGQLEAAVEHFAQSLRISRDDPKALNNLGLVLVRLDRYPEAISALKRAVQVEPGSAEAHHNLGLALAGSNRNPEAIEQFQLALKTKPDFAFAQYNLGIALAREGRFPEAHGHFREAVRLRPEDPQYRARLQKVESILGDRQEGAPGQAAPAR